MGPAKHTPGVWVANGNQIEAKSRLNTIICTTGGSGVQYATNGRPDEAKANAKLIAAAPDMVEALKGLLFAQQHLISQFDDADLDAVDKARTALAKAVQS